MSIEKVMYRAHAKVTGGRDGRAVSSGYGLDRGQRWHRPDPHRLRDRSRAEDQRARTSATASASLGTESPHRLPVLQCNARQHRREAGGGVSTRQPIQVATPSLVKKE